MKEKILSKIKSVSTKAWIRIAFAFVCLILLVIISAYKSTKINSLYDQSVGKEWVKNSNAGAQVSVIFNIGTKVDDNVINDFRYYLTSSLSKVLDSTVYDETDDPLDGPFDYAYSGTGTVDLVTSLMDDESFTDISAIGVGGDFFLFHPVNIVTGRYFDSSYSDQDSIILDSYTANHLYGSYDCIGSEILINNIPHYVRGVYDPSDDSFFVKGGGQQGFVFVPYASLDKLGTSNGISCIEVVSENAIENYLINLIKDDQNNQLPKDSYEVVDNTARYNIPNLINVISDFGVRSMKSRSIVYPYWENVARGYEDIFALLLIIQTLLWTILIVMLIAYLSYRVKHSSFTMKVLSDKAYELKDDIRQKHIARNKIKAKEHARNKKEKSKWKDF